MKFVSGGSIKECAISSLVIAGWTARDAEVQDKHIRELEELGVARPKETPTFYRASKELITHNHVIDVIGKNSTGEVEIFLINLTDGIYVGVGSDHTDRALETEDITLSKQCCPKPVSREVWSLDDVVDHWDDLIVRSYITERGERVIYQDARLSDFLTPNELIDRGSLFEEEDCGCIVFCGTAPTIGAIRPSSRYELELIDPIKRKRITHAYEVNEIL